MTEYPPLTLTLSQRVVMDAILNTLVGPMTVEQEEALVRKVEANGHIYKVTPSNAKSLSKITADSLDLTSLVVELLGKALHPDARGDFLSVLDGLNTTEGSQALTGFAQPFVALSRQQREHALASWRTSPVESMCTLYKTFTGLCFSFAYSSKRTSMMEGIAYEDCDAFFKQHPDYESVDHERMPMMSTEEATTKKLAYDVVVVGSGAGGGVAAAELATAGYSVLVIERGKYYHHSELMQCEDNDFQKMYDSSGMVPTVQDNVDSLLANVFGGGTTVNYSVCIKTQDYVRKEWAESGLTHFASPQYDEDLDRVFKRIGASKDKVENKASKKLKEGCDALNYHFEKVHLNTNGKRHYCLRCHLGCSSGIKQGTQNTWLRDALNHGAQFLDRTKVNRVVIKNGKAVGVECQVRDAEDNVFISAKRVIASCGTLRTPLLLQSSGLKNPNIGQNIRLQPATMCIAYFDEPIMQQSEGHLISSISFAPENWNGDYYGSKIEDVGMIPGLLSSRLPWYSSAHHKDLMLRHKTSILSIILVRDKDSNGQLLYDPKSDTPIIDYKISSHDEKSFVVGIETNMKIFVAAGARELYSPQPNVEPFIFGKEEEISVSNPRFIRWLETIRKAGVMTITTPIAAAHHISSCRMGIDPKTSATKPNGETWDVKNLYVADASIIPTAIGVNPMVTIEATSLHVSRQVIASLRKNSTL
ncbi:hypothetical protein EDC96DRAFT_493371 [Choanephora cucurbitarum]|nr:hypothetical protein EDC96DRAFT_493371 [Choanephora cucurbitarum]